MYSIPDFTVDACKFPLITFDAKMFPVVESSQPGQTIGRFFLAASTIHESFGSIS